MNKKKSIRSGQRWLIWGTMVPLICFYVLFYIGFPIVFALIISLSEWNIISPQKPFVGLKNYIEAFYDPVFHIALWNTFYYTFVTVPIGAALALVFALMINTVKFKNVFRTVYFLPVVTSMVACAILWRWLYQPRFGLFNQLLNMVGIPSQIWLQSPELALSSIMVMSIWKGLGYNIVLFLAGLTGIPRVYHEAAQIDGANRWQKFKHITIPLLQPTILFVIVIGVINSFQVFTQVYIMSESKGGPLYATTVMVLYIYDKAFHLLRMGYGSAMAFVLFGIVLVFTIIQLNIGKTRWEY